MDKKYFETRKGSLEDKINNIASEQPTINATYKPDVKLTTEKKYFETKKGSIEELAGKLIESKLDPVDKDAVKKKFDDRKDKDIDNDGDTDSTDKYLHKRRAAISKATSEAVTQDDHGEKINQDKKDAAMKKTDQKKDFKSLRAETKIIKLGDKGKTATGKDAGAIDVEPSAKPI